MTRAAPQSGRTDRLPPQVLHLVTGVAFAGIERHALTLIREQQALGWRAVLACPAAAHRLRAEATKADITVIPTPPGRPRTWLVPLLRDVLADRPDVLHAHDGRSALVGACLSTALGGIFVRTQHFVHTATMDRRGWVRRASLALHRRVNHRLDGYVAVSQSVARAAQERHETGDAVLVVIPPAIELPTQAAVARAREARMRKDHPVVVFAGRLEAERRLDVLLRAIPLVRTELPECRFSIAGTGDAERELRQLAADLQATDAIFWAGWVAETYAVLADAHLYVNTWPREAFGMAMAEAMALALPIVAVDAGANTEMVDAGVTGFLVPVDDSAAMAAAIVDLLRDRAVAAEMGEAARERAVAAFGGRLTAVSTLALYERLLEPSAS